MMVKLKKKVNELLFATHSIIKYTFDVVFLTNFNLLVIFVISMFKMKRNILVIK